MEKSNELKAQTVMLEELDTWETRLDRSEPLDKKAMLLRIISKARIC